MKNKIWLICFVFVCSCEENRISNKGVTSDLTVVSILDKMEDDNVTDPLFDDLELVFLETRDDILMAGCNKVEFFKNRFYVLDKQFSNLLAFDRTGKFLFRIGSLGNGPGEYQSIYGFEVDQKNEKVLVYSLDTQTILEYDLDGNYLANERIDFYGYDFSLAANGNYVFNLRYNDNGLYAKDNVFVTNAQGKVKAQYFPYPKEATSMVVTFSGFFTMDGNTGYYTNAYSDTLYRLDIEEQEATPLLRLGLGKKTWPHGYDFNKIYTEDYLSYHSLGSSAFVHDNLLFFSFQESEILRGKTAPGITPKMGILDIETGKLITTNSAEDEFLLKYGIAIPEGIMPDGKYISAMGAGSLELIKKNYQNSWEAVANKYKAFKQESSNIREEKNPALVLYNFNK